MTDPTRPEAPASRYAVEAVRFLGEAQAARAVRGDTWLADLVAAATAAGGADAQRVRRQLLARSVLLTEGMAPEAWAQARAAAKALGVTGPLELFQSAGDENAGIHLVQSPVLLEIRGRLLSLLDAGATLAVFGHELGHWLAHGPDSPDGALGLVVSAALNHGAVPEHAARHVSALSMAREITADRFGLLACGSLDSALRLEMATTTGLSAGDLTWDTAAYLAQCRSLIEAVEAEGSAVLGRTHPEHGLRAWALWLWSESDRYHALTGKGPGSRPIDEVEARIAKVMGNAPAGGLAEGALMLDPVPEVHECALAAAVLVALSDGSLSEEEALAIEAVFGHLVADWQRYLAWDSALEAFADTGAVVIAGGAGAQRAVFQVLVHVLAADGKVEQSEIEMVCSVGDALRCGTLYRALLSPVLRTLGVEAPDLDGVVKPIPMPARADEAEAALEIFLRGVLRRGGGEASPRRMSRLLGDQDCGPESLATVQRLLDAVGLEAEGEMAEWPRDRPLRLRPTEAARLAMNEDAAPIPRDIDEPARKRLSTALARLRDQLVNGDGRSPSIRLRRTRSGRSFDLAELEGLSVGHAERVLTLVRAGSRARVVDGREVGVHDGAARVSRELVALEREAIGRTEETGARDLYVGGPFLTGVIGGYLVRAPILLHPVDLERSQGRGFALVPRPGEPAVANQALVRLLFAKKGLSFPDDLAETLNQAAESGAEALRSVLAQQGIVARPETEALQALEPRDEAFATWPDGRVVLESCAVLGFFPQSSSDMIQDYDALIAAVADPSLPLAEHLGAAGALLPADLRQALEITDSVPSSPAPLVPVVAADPSQLAVLRQARSRRALVVDGPPGTGKSQVIVNLVVDALSRGETVAVVCEKRAALDVVAQRLDAVGLRHLLAVVHDVNEDRRPLFEQVLRRLDEGLSRDHDAVAAARLDEELAAVTEALIQRRAALATALGEGQPSLGQLHVLAASFSEAPLEGLDPGLARLPLDTARRVADRLGREARNRDLHQQGAPWRPPAGQQRPSLAEADPDRLMQVEEALRAAGHSAQALQRLHAEQGIDDGPVRRAQAEIAAALAGRPDRATPGNRAATAAFLRLAEEPALAELVAQVERCWQTAGDWIGDAPERVAFEGSPELETALTITEGWGSRFLRFFSWGWWTARGLVRRSLAQQWPAGAVLPFGPPLLQRLRHRQAAATAWKALDKLLAALDLRPVLPDAPAAQAQAAVLVAAWQQTRALVHSRPALVAADAWPAPDDADLVQWELRLDARLQLAQASAAHAAAFAPARQALPWLPETPDPDSLRALLEAWSMDAARVVASDRNLDAAAALYPQARDLLRRLADQLPEGTALNWSEAFQHGHARLALSAIERRFPQTRTLDRPTPMGEVTEAESELAELVESRARAHVARILAERDRVALLTEARPEHGARRSPLQRAREQMLREAAKRRYVLSLRGFVRQFADQGLLEALPVWLVSPETMAVLFPGRPAFHLVVMDEASQATVEKGFPALIRGHRAVVAGDERQMPPTSYFELKTPGEDEVGTAATVEADALTAESLLVLARERCQHAGLRWHYRCLHEELIAFSNHAMYGGGLYTVPSVSTPDAAPALTWVQVEDGAYDRGANPIEAERVVDQIAALLAESQPPSVGVVTFNVEQRQVILDALDKRAEADADFGLRWSAANTHEVLDQRPFVKNLESVQGDERDVILFSLGHAPVPRKSGRLAGSLYVPARFGPLGQRGGERRLNVAVSRAKRACIVVASFTPDLLSVADSKHEGPRLLKAFLEFAWDLTHGRRRLADKTLERVRSGSMGSDGRTRRPDTLGVASLAAQIALGLEDRGVAFDLDVGASGFRVPLALRDPARPQHWTVAVITEEGHEVGDVDELHRHVPGLLRARGWAVERVEARAWHQDPAAVLDRLQASLQGDGGAPPASRPGQDAQDAAGVAPETAGIR